MWPIIILYILTIIIYPIPFFDLAMISVAIFYITRKNEKVRVSRQQITGF